MKRGSYGFMIGGEGQVLDTPENVEALRKLWLGRELVEGYYLGPGNPGDFDHGAWHVGCHLVAAGGVRQTKNGSLLWLEISHDMVHDQYYGSVTRRVENEIKTSRLDSAEGRALVYDSKLLGFVEGNSVGRISARGISDPPNLFHLWRRQDFDQPIDSKSDGGKVWEHWCTLRDIRESSRIGTSILTAFVSLVSALGDKFPASVARGRRDYGHPDQLCAMIEAGFVSKEVAFWDIIPRPITSRAEELLLAADPPSEFEGVENLEWEDQPQYYMYPRRIKSWSAAKDVKDDWDKWGS